MNFAFDPMFFCSSLVAMKVRTAFWLFSLNCLRTFTQRDNRCDETPTVLGGALFLMVSTSLPPPRFSARKAASSAAGSFPSGKLTPFIHELYAFLAFGLGVLTGSDRREETGGMDGSSFTPVDVNNPEKSPKNPDDSWGFSFFRRSSFRRFSSCSFM